MAEEQAVLDGRKDVTIDEALPRYKAYLESGEDGDPLKPSSIYQTMKKLGTMFTDGTEMLEAQTAARCEALYTDLRTRIAPRTGKPYSADWHINALAQAKTFHKWCMRRQLIAANGFTMVAPWGCKNERDTQPTIDEARAFIDEAIWLVHKRGEEGALAALIALMMGLRGGTIVARVARDVDDDGTRLHTGRVRDAAGEVVWSPKRRKKMAQLVKDIPSELQPYLLALKAKATARGGPFTNLWTEKHWRDWVRKWVGRICDRVKIPRYTAHDLRRAYGTFEYQGGREEAERRAKDGLQHDDFAVSRRHYVDAGAIGSFGQAAALKVMRGGKKG
jgi:integrase